MVLIKMGFKDILDVWEIDYLTNVKNKLRKDTQVTSARWMLMDRDHVLGAIKIGDELESFLTNPPDGWNSISYKNLKDGEFGSNKTFPIIAKERYKQLENFIRYYDSNFFRSPNKMKETVVLYFDKDHPIIVWIESEDLAVFIAPQIIV